MVAPLKKALLIPPSEMQEKVNDALSARETVRRGKICMVTSIHPDFDARIYKMARSVSQAGFQIDLICPWNVREGLHEGIHYRPFRPARSRLMRVCNYTQIWKMLGAADYDLYHFHDIDILPLFSLFALLKRKPVIYDIHENYADEMRVKPYLPRLLRPLVAFCVYWGERVCARVINNLVVVVDSLEQAYNTGRFNVVKVRNFATLDLVRKSAGDYEQREDAVIFIGSQYLENGSLLFLDIAKKVHAINHHVMFYCIDRFGDDDHFKEKFVKTIEDYNLGDNVKMLPNVKPQEIMSYVNMATIGISPNLNVPNQKKGIHTKIFEYMAGGIPVVASNHPYHIDFIEENGAGLLADPDNCEEFAEKIVYLLNNRAEAKKMGERGLEAFRERYCWEKEEVKLVSMYREILQAKREEPRHGKYTQKNTQ